MAELPPLDPITSLPPINTDLPNSAGPRGGPGAGAKANQTSKQYQKKAIEAITKKQQRKFDIPTIDFTQHQLDNGDVVSTTERVVKDVQAPAMLPPTDEQFYSKTDPSKPDIAFLKNHFYREGRLTQEQALFILEKYVLNSHSERLALSLTIFCSSLLSEVEKCYVKNPTCWRSTHPSLCAEIYTDNTYVSLVPLCFDHWLTWFASNSMIS